MWRWLFSNQLKQLGAEVWACDGAESFIEIAKNDFENIDFRVCDLTQKLPYADQSFDFVVSSLVLMDIEKIDTFFVEARRVLKPNGRLVFSIMHPSFFLPDWERDEQGNKIYKKVQKYWGEEKRILNFWGETTHYHRTLSWYSKLLKTAGLAIEEIKENPSDEKTFEGLDERKKRIPLFIAFSCVKNNV